VWEYDDVAERQDGEKSSHALVYGLHLLTTQQTPEHSRRSARSRRWTERMEENMASDREKISTGPNAEPINETIAGTGPGIADDALAPGEELPEQPSEETVERASP
jgi:hypothetical protein